MLKYTHQSMMQFDFFATDDDLKQIWRLLFDIPNMQIFEHHSEPDQPNQWIKKWEDFLVHFENHKGFLAAWPTSVGGRPRERWIEFEPNTKKSLGGRGQTILETPALVQIFKFNDLQGCLTNSSITCWNEKGARQRSSFSEQFCDEIDWQQLRSILSKIQRQIRKMSPANLRKVPIMPNAFEEFRTGRIALWNFGQECRWPSQFVSTL